MLVLVVGGVERDVAAVTSLPSGPVTLGFGCRASRFRPQREWPWLQGSPTTRSVSLIRSR